MPPDLTDMAFSSVRTLRAFGQRIPGAGGILAHSLEDAIKGRIVLITGASSGIGEAAALDIGRARGTVLLVARTRAKLEAVAEQVEEAGGTGYVHPCDLTDIDDIERMAQRGARPARARRRADQQRRQIDPAFGQPLVRPLSRLPADHAAQLFRAREADPRAAADDARARLRAHRQHLDDRAADEHAPVRCLPGVEGGARRLLALDRARDHRRRRPRHDRLHAARPHADDRADQDLRPLPDAEPRGGGADDRRRDP